LKNFRESYEQKLNYQHYAGTIADCKLYTMITTTGVPNNNTNWITLNIYHFVLAAGRQKTLEKNARKTMKRTNGDFL